MCRSSDTSDIKKHFSPRLSVVATRSPPRALYSVVYTATVVVVRRCAASIRLTLAADWTTLRPVSIIPGTSTIDLHNKGMILKSALEPLRLHRHVDRTSVKPSGWVATWRIAGCVTARHFTAKQSTFGSYGVDGKYMHSKWYISMYTSRIRICSELTLLLCCQWKGRKLTWGTGGTLKMFQTILFIRQWSYEGSTSSYAADLPALLVCSCSFAARLSPESSWALGTFPRQYCCSSSRIS
jgi:hypothetical protein